MRSRIWGVGAVGLSITHPKFSQCDADIKTIPTGCQQQRFRPTVPYGDWDANWDHRNAVQTPKAMTIALGIATSKDTDPDYAEAIRHLYRSHTTKSQEDVEAIIAKAQSPEALATHFRGAFLRYCGVTRHIILIRHGQYDEAYNKDEYYLGPRSDHMMT